MADMKTRTIAAVLLGVVAGLVAVATSWVMFPAYVAGVLVGMWLTQGSGR